MSASTVAPRSPLLAARDLVKSYRRGPEEVHALRGVSFSIEPAEVVALVGPSGSGKTTLINVLCGWEHADSGEMLWQGEARPIPPEGRPWAELSIVPQDLGLIEELSVRENIELPIRLGRNGLDREKLRSRASGLIRGFGLDMLEDRTPGEISLGEQQRTALSRALVLTPTLLLADEPTAHQDAGWVKGVLRAFHMAAGEGSSCLIATHSREALKFVDRIVAIRDGAIEPETAARAVLAPEHDSDLDDVQRFHAGAGGEQNPWAPPG